MSRQTLNQQGARRGKIGPKSLQLGNVVVAFKHIGALLLSDGRFHPYDTSSNKKMLGVFSVFGAITTFVLFLVTVWWVLALTKTWAEESVILAGWLAFTLLVCFIFLQAMALHLRKKINREEPYFRLMIECTSGTRFAVVGIDRIRLEELKDTLRQKIDNPNADITGAFDLETDFMMFEGADTVAKEEPELRLPPPPDDTEQTQD